MNQWWSWMLIGFGLTGYLLVGSKLRVGWLVLIGNEMLWTVYAVQTRQWGFLLGAVLYAVAFAVNLTRWKPDSAG